MLVCISQICVPVNSSLHPPYEAGAWHCSQIWESRPGRLPYIASPRKAMTPSMLIAETCLLQNKVQQPILILTNFSCPKPR